MFGQNIPEGVIKLSNKELKEKLERSLVTFEGIYIYDPIFMAEWMKRNLYKKGLQDAMIRTASKAIYAHAKENPLGNTQERS